MLRDFQPHPLGDIITRFMAPPRNDDLASAALFSHQRTWPLRLEETFYLLPIDWEYDGDEQVGSFIDENNLDYSFHGDQLYDVIHVARGQRPNLTVADVLEAYNHYLEYDAFLEWRS